MQNRPIKGRGFYRIVFLMKVYKETKNAPLLHSSWLPSVLQDTAGYRGVLANVAPLLKNSS